MFCGPKTSLMLSEATLMEFAIVIMLAGIPDVGRHVSRFCAYASDEEDETPAAKIRRSRKSLARTREITAHLPDQNMGGGVEGTSGFRTTSCSVSLPTKNSL